MTEFEIEYWKQGKLRVVGVDEVGRGSVAGPIGVGAAVLDPHTTKILGVTDSKQLTRLQRQRLYQEITTTLHYRVDYATSIEIDEVGIIGAYVLALKRALDGLNFDAVLIDGRFKAGTFDWLTVPIKQIVRGDRLSYSIACASILAKVERDRLMVGLSRSQLKYGWERNKGYGTRTHLEAIAKYGLTAQHRKSFLHAI